MKWAYHVLKFSPSGALFRGGKIDDVWLAKELNVLGGDRRVVTGIFSSAIGNGATNEVAVVLKRPLP